jgi:flagella basal body P-ring formation protein FlgA
MARRLASLALALAVLSATPAFAQERQVVLVPNRVIYPGETIDLSALREVALKPGRAAPDATAILPGQLEGKVARRTLLPGRYVQAASIRQPYLVEQGAAVQVLFVAGSLTIAASAVTLQPGSAGDMVKVRNLDSGKILTGIVMADGTVRVGAS